MHHVRATEAEIIELLKAGWKVNAICKHLHTGRERIVGIATKEGINTYKPPVFADYKERIEELILAGDSVPVVAEKIGIVQATVYEWVRRMNLKPALILDDIRRKKIAAMLEEKPMYRVKVELGMSTETLKRLMDEMGLKPRKREPKPKAPKPKKVKAEKLKPEKKLVIKTPTIKAEKPKPLVTEVVDPDDMDEPAKLRQAKKKAAEIESLKPRESIISRFRRKGLITTHQPSYFDEQRWVKDKAVREETR